MSSKSQQIKMMKLEKKMMELEKKMMLLEEQMQAEKQRQADEVINAARVVVLTDSQKFVVTARFSDDCCELVATPTMQCYKRNRAINVYERVSVEAGKMFVERAKNVVAKVSLEKIWQDRTKSDLPLSPALRAIYHLLNNDVQMCKMLEQAIRRDSAGSITTTL